MVFGLNAFRASSLQRPSERISSAPRLNIRPQRTDRVDPENTIAAQLPEVAEGEIKQMLRIQKELNGRTTTLRLSGRIRADSVATIREE